MDVVNEGYNSSKMVSRTLCPISFWAAIRTFVVVFEHFVFWTAANVANLIVITNAMGVIMWTANFHPYGKLHRQLAYGNNRPRSKLMIPMALVADEKFSGHDTELNVIVTADTTCAQDIKMVNCPVT